MTLIKCVFFVSHEFELYFLYVVIYIPQKIAFCRLERLLLRCGTVNGHAGPERCGAATPTTPRRSTCVDASPELNL